MALDREFFAALADVVFGNPFTPKRDQLILRLAPGAPATDLFSDPEALARVVRPKLEPLLREGRRALTRLSGEERQLVVPALLYVNYHRAIPHFDRLIEKQADRSSPLPAPFGPETI